MLDARSNGVPPRRYGSCKASSRATQPNISMMGLQVQAVYRCERGRKTGIYAAGFVVCEVFRVEQAEGAFKSRINEVVYRRTRTPTPELNERREL